ncbi:hypothetical protein SAMN05216223_126116 [Actinacidiphila yanglinensis]|uniref:Lipoprotein n=1 Tax=Actinacidiphila yanglinensis TaxID=310779 RepID=A0A1H6E5E2_9ACTN|nr:hypothetical protein [Actinacidiphila yanglinensis]SEG92847.1 hypothetical protein SAMN05216223_126116 [Actinacidiphila yanglinensis]
MIPKPTRRSAVAIATLGLVAGCSGSRGSASAADPHADAEQQAREVRDSTALVARYDAVTAAYPKLTARLAPLRADTAAHVRAFGGRAPAAPSTHASGSAATASPTPSGPASAVPATSDKALAALATAERALADRRAATLLDAPGGLARLLASVAAAGAGHVALLGPPAGK